MTSFPDDLRRWLLTESSQRAERAQRAEPPQPSPDGTPTEGCARSARCARQTPGDNDPLGPVVVSADILQWGSAAIEVYIERLAIGDELGMDTSAGSEAEQVARREARRVAAGVPAEDPASRDGDLIDQTLEAFAPLQLTFLRWEPRQSLPPTPEGPKP